MHGCCHHSSGHRPAVAYLPDNLDLSFLPPTWQDPARFLIGRLYLARHIAGDGAGPDGYQRLYSPLLRRLLGREYRSMLFTPLLDHGIIEEDSSYRALRGSGYSKGFRLAEPYRHARFRTVLLSHPELLRRLAREYIAQERELEVPVYRHLRGWLNRLTVVPGYPADVLPLRVLADGEHRMSVCKQGRVHTDLTNLARIHRQHLVLQGTREPLYALDVRTCQPLLLGLALRDRERLERDRGYAEYAAKLAQPKGRAREEGGNKPERSLLPYVGIYSDSCQSDFERYIEVCLCGDLYELFVTATGYSRNEVKKYFLATVYGRPHQARGTKTGRAFQSTFPELWSMLEMVNAEDHSLLPRFLQTVESWLVIWRTCGRLAETHPDAPLLTIHDCLVTTEPHVERFQAVLKSEFQAVWDVCPQMEVKRLAA